MSEMPRLINHSDLSVEDFAIDLRVSKDQNGWWSVRSLDFPDHSSTSKELHEAVDRVFVSIAARLLKEWRQTREPSK